MTQKCSITFKQSLPNLKQQKKKHEQGEAGLHLCKKLQIFVLQGLSITSSAEERFPYQPPYFLKHKQDCFFQTFSLAASSAPECLCDLHYSEVSNPLTTGGNDKTPYHHLEVSRKRQVGSFKNKPCLN